MGKLLVPIAAELPTQNSIWDYFSQTGFMPHGHCFLWKPGLLSAHIISDSLIGVAYISIALILYALAKRLKLEFSSILLFFGVFIGACGLTHFVQIWTLWNPDYWMSASVKAITAIASVGTGFYLFRLRTPIVNVTEAARLAEARRIKLEESTFDLIARENTLSSFFNSAPMMMGIAEVTENDIRHISDNLAAAQFFGRSPEQMRGRLASELGVPREGIDLWLGYYREAETRQTPIQFEYSHQLEGVERGARTFSVVVSHIGKEPSGQARFSYIVQDITGVRKTEAELRDAKNLLEERVRERTLAVEKIKADLQLERDKLRAIIENLDTGIGLTSAQGEILSLNPEGLRIHGFSSGAEMFAKVDQYAQQFEIQDLNGNILPIEEWPISRAVRGEAVQDFQVKLVRKADGDIKYLNYGVAPLYGANGEITNLVFNISDETESRRGEEKLRASEQRLKASESTFRTMANNIPQLAWMTDPSGYITWYNQRWYDYTGTTLEQMQGWGWRAVHHPDHSDRVTEKWLKHLKSGEFWEDTFPLRRKDGEYRWFLSRASVVHDESGQILHWLGTNTDITDQMQIERELAESRDIAEKANLAKSQFLANMSHEIRTPIGVIMGFSDLLKNQELSQLDRVQYTSVIERNSNQLLRLIDDVLDLSKVEAGKLSIDKNWFLLSEFLLDVASVMNLKAKEKGIEFALRLKGRVPREICTDLTRLRQILLNIVGNAIKFTDEGRVEVHVSYQKDFLEFMVDDSGIGISHDHLGHLFHPFGQADPSLTRRYGGTGLGLVLSKRLAQALGGDVTLQHSQMNQGSRFLICIQPTLRQDPVMVGSNDLMAPKAEASRSDRFTSALNGIKLLLVEDSPDNRTLIHHYLRKTGAQILVAEDGRIGLELARQHEPDLILMDIQMPNLDGHQATRQLRKEGYAGPVVALTAHAMKEERDRCFASGFSDYLTKPISRDRLLETLVHHSKRNLQ